MAQGVLPFKYEEEKTGSGMTALAGLPTYLDLAKVIGLSKSIRKHLKIRKDGQGWEDAQVVMSIILLNLAGGDCVDDIKILEADEGFCAILRMSELHGLKRKIRRALERRWRKEKKRSVPSASSIFRYLSKFHDAEQEATREKTDVKAFILGRLNPTRLLARFLGLIKIVKILFRASFLVDTGRSKNRAKKMSPKTGF